jgi:hypothetical protein
VFVLDSGVLGMIPPSVGGGQLSGGTPRGGGSRGGSVAENLALWQLSVGDLVQSLYLGGSEYYPGKITRARVDGSYDIKYDDGDKEESVPRNSIELDNSMQQGGKKVAAAAKGKGKAKGKKRKHNGSESEDEEVTLYVTKQDEELPSVIAQMFDLDVPTLLRWNKKRLKGIRATSKLQIGTSVVVAKETEQAELRVTETGALLWMKLPRAGMTTACIAKHQQVDAKAYHTFLATFKPFNKGGKFDVKAFGMGKQVRRCTYNTHCTHFTCSLYPRGGSERREREEGVSRKERTRAR